MLIRGSHCVAPTRPCPPRLGSPAPCSLWSREAPTHPTCGLLPALGCRRTSSGSRWACDASFRVFRTRSRAVPCRSPSPGTGAEDVCGSTCWRGRRWGLRPGSGRRTRSDLNQDWRPEGCEGRRGESRRGGRGDIRGSSPVCPALPPAAPPGPRPPERPSTPAQSLHKLGTPATGSPSRDTLPPRGSRRARLPRSRNNPVAPARVPDQPPGPSLRPGHTAVSRGTPAALRASALGDQGGSAACGGNGRNAVPAAASSPALSRPASRPPGPRPVSRLGPALRTDTLWGAPLLGPLAPSHRAPRGSAGVAHDGGRSACVRGPTRRT